MNNVELKTLEDILSDMIGNMSDQQLGEEVQLFEFVAKRLGVKDYTKLYVLVDDGDHDPSWVLGDNLQIPYNSYKLFMYPEHKMIAEYNKSGNIFMYFVTENDAQKYLDLANKFLTEFDIDENSFVNLDDSESVNVWNLTGDENTHQLTVNDIEKELNFIDMKTNNKFDLLNKYLSQPFTKEARFQLLDMLNNPTTYSDIEKFLSPDHTDEKQAITETKARGVHGRYQVEVYDEGDWHTLSSWNTVTQASEAGKRAVEAVYQDYRIIDKETDDIIDEDEYLVEDLHETVLHDLQNQTESADSGVFTVNDFNLVDDVLLWLDSHEFQYTLKLDETTNDILVNWNAVHKRFNSDDVISNKELATKMLAEISELTNEIERIKESDSTEPAAMLDEIIKTRIEELMTFATQWKY